MGFATADKVDFMALHWASKRPDGDGPNEHDGMQLAPRVVPAPIQHDRHHRGRDRLTDFGLSAAVEELAATVKRLAIRVKPPRPWISILIDKPGVARLNRFSENPCHKIPCIWTLSPDF